MPLLVLFLVLVLILLVLLALAGWQFIVYSKDKVIFEAKLTKLEVEHAKLAKIDEQKKELKAELARTTRSLEKARKKLPAGPEIDVFKKRIQKYAKKSGYVTSSVEKKDDAVQEGLYYYIDTDTKALGRKGRADKFLVHLKGDPRLMVVTHDRYMRAVGSVSLTVRLFYMPTDEYSCAVEDLCEYPHQPSTWLPPFAGWIKEMENDMAVTCESINEMADLSLDVCALENTKEELVKLTEVIKVLEKK